METEINIPKTLQQAILQYADEDKCLELLMAARWSNSSPVCPYCGSIEVGFIKSRRLFQCKEKECRKQFSIKVGTYMEDSALKLSAWLPAMWLITNAKNGISSHEIARSLGVTQKTAWFMLHRIRLAFSDQPTNLSGRVEADETYIGGKAANKHQNKRIAGRGMVGKVAVLGMLERGGKARAGVIHGSAGVIIQPEIRKHVQPGSELITDAHGAYPPLADAYIHAAVDHAIEYVRDHVHTNGMENFFSLLKRMIKGTYVSIAPEHLDAYVGEQVFRYNERKDTDGGRFRKVVKETYGKRLTWKQLTDPTG